MRNDAGGRLVRYDARPSDVWSAGATLFKMITGREVYKASPRTAVDAAERDLACMLDRQVSP